MCVYTVYIIYKKKSIHRGYTYIRVGWCYFLLSCCRLYSFISFRYLFLSFFFHLAFSGPPFLVGVPCILGFCVSIAVVVVSLLSTRLDLLPYLYTPTAKGSLPIWPPKTHLCTSLYASSFYLQTVVVVDDRHEENVDGMRSQSRDDRSEFQNTSKRHFKYGT